MIYLRLCRAVSVRERGGMKDVDGFVLARRIGIFMTLVEHASLCVIRADVGCFVS